MIVNLKICFRWSGAICWQFFTFFSFFFVLCWIPKGKSHREHFFVSIEKIQTMCNTYKYKQASWGQDYRTWNTECWIFYQQNTPNNNFWLRFTANVDVAARQTDVKTDGQCNSDRYTDGRMTDTQHDWQKDRTNIQTTWQTDGRTDKQINSMQFVYMLSLICGAHSVYNGTIRTYRWYWCDCLGYDFRTVLIVVIL